MGRLNSLKELSALCPRWHWKRESYAEFRSINKLNPRFVLKVNVSINVSSFEKEPYIHTLTLTYNGGFLASRSFYKEDALPFSLNLLLIGAARSHSWDPPFREPARIWLRELCRG